MAATRPLILAGPTASGKSALALAAAERDGGRIINADALQVYGCWRILTARPDAAAEARAPHRLYGHVAMDAPHSVGEWLRAAAREIAAARAAGARPIIVGGTGLYLHALLSGLAAAPPTPPALRAQSQALIDGGRLDVLLDRLARDDPETHARIDRKNPMRVQRAWEVLEATGRPISAWRRATPPPALRSRDADLIVVDPEKSLLNRRIESRFYMMVEGGALDEVARFLAAGGDLAKPSGRALGAAELAAHLDGRLGLDDAIRAAVVATRRYAKRQRTWFRNRFAGWRRIEGPEAIDLVP